MLHDLRYGIRTLSKTPGYTAVACLALALGIGAVTAIFSFVDVMLLRPLPYPNADRLGVPISINAARGIDRASIAYADYEDWKREPELFSAVAVYQASTATISGGDANPEEVPAVLVSEDFFRVLPVTPVAGRVLTAADSAASAVPVAVISYGLWQRRFAGDPAVIGRDLGVGGVRHTIVGVLATRAIHPETAELVLPLVPSRFAAADRARRDNFTMQAVGRLADGLSWQQADTRLKTMAGRIAAEHPIIRKDWTVGILPLRGAIVEPTLRIALYVLLGAVGAVLLIACANLANLTLVRGAGRAREMGLRLAIGASRRRLIRQLAAESMVLGAAGGLAGIGVAALAVPALAALVPANAPFLDQVTLETRVMLMALSVTLLTIVVTGLLPALTASAVDPAGALKAGARAASAARTTTTLRSALVVAEIALAVVLLVAAGLLMRSLERATSRHPGVDLDRVLSARIGVPGFRYAPPQRVEFFERLLDDLAAQPGVQAAAATSYLPAGGGGFGLGRVFLAEGAPEPPAGVDTPAMWTVVTPDYFRVMGIPLVRGRAFTRRDRLEATPVMVVSESFSRRMFGDADPVGRRIRSWRDENVYREIVGVVRDVAFSSLTDHDRAIVYVPHAQQGWGGMALVLRAEAGAPDQLTPTLRRVVSAADSELALARLGTLELFASNSVARERLSATLMSALALAALTLAVIGVYGIMSYTVAMRRQEMGVRLALGASPGHLYRAVLGRGLALTAVGLVAGLAGAIAAGRVLRALLYETSPLDPLAFGAMAALLGTTALVACWLPARRAATADPLTTLRAE